MVCGPQGIGEQHGSDEKIRELGGCGAVAREGSYHFWMKRGGGEGQIRRYQVPLCHRASWRPAGREYHPQAAVVAWAQEVRGGLKRLRDENPPETHKKRRTETLEVPSDLQDMEIPLEDMGDVIVLTGL